MQGLESIFSYQDKQVRVVMVEDEPWFCAKDVCEILEIGDTRRAVERLDEDERILTPLTDGVGRLQHMYVVNEPGLYSLILGSRAVYRVMATQKNFVTEEPDGNHC